jgi:hypothetical protein
MPEKFFLANLINEFKNQADLTTLLQKSSGQQLVSLHRDEYLEANNSKSSSRRKPGSSVFAFLTRIEFRDDLNFPLTEKIHSHTKSGWIIRRVTPPATRHPAAWSARA